MAQLTRNDEFLKKRTACLVERLDGAKLDSNVKQFCENVANKVNLTKRAGNDECSSGKLNIPQEDLEVLLNDLAEILNDDGFDVHESLGHKKNESTPARQKANEIPKRGAAKRKPKPKTRPRVEAPTRRKTVGWSPLKEVSGTQWFQARDGYTSLNDAYPSLFQQNSDEIKPGMLKPKIGRPKKSDPLKIPPNRDISSAANSTVFQIHNTSKSLDRDDSLSTDHSAILPNSQVEYAQSTQIDHAESTQMNCSQSTQVDQSTQTPDDPNKTAQKNRKRKPKSNSTQHLQNCIERVQSQDPNASFGILTFKQVPLSNVKIIYASEKGKQFAPILPKSDNFTRVQLSDVQIAQTVGAQFPAGRRNAKTSKRVALLPVLWGNACPNTTLNNSVSSNASQSAQQRILVKPAISTVQSKQEQKLKTCKSPNVVKSGSENNPDVFFARKFCSVSLNEPLINGTPRSKSRWAMTPKKLPKSKTVLTDKLINRSIGKQSSKTTCHCQLRNKNAHDVMCSDETGSESEDDLSLSAIKTRVNEQIFSKHSTTKVDDHLFGYTYSKTISNKVDKDYSLFYKKIEPQKQQDLSQSKKENINFEIRVYPDVVVDQNASLNSNLGSKRAYRVNKPRKMPRRKIECPPDCYCWRDGEVEDSNESFSFAEQPPKRRIQATKLESYTQNTSVLNRSTVTEISHPNHCNERDHIETNNSEITSCFTDSGFIKSTADAHSVSVIRNAVKVAQRSEVDQLDLSNCDEMAAINKSARSKTRVSRLLSSDSEVSDCEAPEAPAPTSTQNCELDDSVKKSGRKKLRVSRLLSSDSEESDQEMNKTSDPMNLQIFEDPNTVKPSVSRKQKRSRLLSSGSENECNESLISSIEKLSSNRTNSDQNAVKANYCPESKLSLFLSSDPKDVNSDVIMSSALKKNAKICEAEESQGIFDNNEDSNSDLNYDSDVSSSSIVFDKKPVQLLANDDKPSIVHDDCISSDDEFDFKSSGVKVAGTFQEQKATVSMLSEQKNQELSLSDSVPTQFNAAEETVLTSLEKPDKTECWQESATSRIPETNQYFESDDEDFVTVFDSTQTSDNLLMSMLANSSKLNCATGDPENCTERMETTSRLEHSSDTSTGSNSPELVSTYHEDKENNNRLQYKSSKEPILMKKFKRKASFIDANLSQTQKAL